MYRLRNLLVLFLVGLGACASSQFRSVAITPAEEPLNIPLVELRGTGQEMGAAHGERFAAAIHQLDQNYLNVALANPRQRLLALTAAKLFEFKLEPAHLDEIRALAAAAKVDESKIMLAQCFLDLTNSMACSTISLPASASPDGIARMGRNLDFPSFDIADKLSIVLVFHPAGRYSFAAVSWPGLIGVLSGMNEQGLVIANMEVDRVPRAPSAMPYTLLYRTVFERCATVQQAIDLLQSTPRQSANNLMLMDAAGDRAVVEITPERIEVRRGQEGQPLVSTNHQRGQDQQSPGKCPRYDLLESSSRNQFGHIGVKEIESMLAGAMQQDLTLQSMIFEPSNRVIYLATGSNAAARHFYRIDLKKYFTASR